MRVSLQNFKMINDDLDKEFQAAVKSINNHEEPFPADTLLKLYSRPKSGKAIINAFKTNALFQVEDITQDEAKKRYIELAKEYLIYRK